MLRVTKLPSTLILARLAVVEPALFEWDVFEMAAPIQSPAKCDVRSVQHTTIGMYAVLPDDEQIVLGTCRGC
jgi:hypothetical protein